MQILCKRSMVIKGVAHEVGDVVEVDNHIGLELVNIGKAEPYEAPVAPKEDRAIGLTTKSAASLLKRGMKKKAK